MAYDEKLADRVRALVATEPGMTEKRMFGGLALLREGHMAVVIRGKGGLMVRVAPSTLDKALAEPGASGAVMRGRPMTGWVVIEPSAVDRAADLRRWVKRGLSACAALDTD
jgi:TfoX/Sxy family transcriptional regulator of competence genes